MERSVSTSLEESWARSQCPQMALPAPSRASNACLPSLPALSNNCSCLCLPFSLFWTFLSLQACSRISHLKMSPLCLIPRELSPHFSTPFDSKTCLELCMFTCIYFITTCTYSLQSDFHLCPMKCVWSECHHDHRLDTQWFFSGLIFLSLSHHLASGHVSFGNTFFTWHPGHELLLASFPFQDGSFSSQTATCWHPQPLSSATFLFHAHSL